MAIEVLTNADNSSIIQRPKHDLESIFYVLLCFCFRYCGPHGSKAVYEGEVPMDKWYLANQSYDSLATWKTGMLYEFENRLMRFIPAYFDNLKGCLYQLFDCVFTPYTYTTPDGRSLVSRAFNNNDATHALMLKVLEDTYTQLPDDEQWSPISRPIRTIGPSSLRHVAISSGSRSKTRQDSGGRRGSGQKSRSVGRVSAGGDSGSIGQDSGVVPRRTRSNSSNRGNQGNGGSVIVGQSGGSTAIGKRRSGDPVTKMSSGGGTTTGKRRSGDPVTSVSSGGTTASTSTSKRRKL